MGSSSYFARTENALDMGPVFDSLGWPRQYVGSVCIAYADVNSDNRLDIVTHLLQGAEVWGGVTNVPSLNRVVVFTAQADGTYKDQTSEVFGTHSPVVLPGWSRKVAVGDINGDGKTDIVYALNREDGRSGSNPAYSSAESAALLSQPDGTYAVTPVGPSNWYHSVGLANIDGNVSVLLAGYANASQPYGGSDSGYVLGGGYSFVWNQTTNSWNDYSPIPIHANTFTILPATSVQYAAIVTVVNDAQDYHQMIGAFVETREGNWVESSLLNPYETSTVNFVSYNGDRGTADLINVDGQFLVAAGYSESQMIHPFPGAAPVAVMKLGGARLADAHTDGFYYQNDGESYQKFDFYSVTNGQLAKKNFTLIDEAHDANGNFFDVMDVNHDELEDIVFYPYSSVGTPDVYINTGAGIFVKLDSSLFPTAPTAWGSATSKMTDLNQDGLYDLVYTPNGVDLSNPAARQWEVYVSQASLPVGEMTTPISVLDRQRSTLIKTFAGDDAFYDTNSSSSTHMDGGLGLDVSFYAGRFENYAVSSLIDGRFVVSGQNVEDTLTSFERLSFSDASLALDIDKWDNAGSAYRLYKAAFDRAPDEAGLGYWIDVLDEGGSLKLAASGFIHSAEFERLYGANASDTVFLTKLYNNVLDRNPDQGGLDYWIGQLNGGMSRESALINFSESNENVSNVAGLIGNGILYQEWLG